MQKSTFIAGIVLLCTSGIAVAQHPVFTDFGKYADGNVSNVRAAGWLHEFLARQAAGMTGHPEALSYPYNSCLWAGDLKREAEHHGGDWWRYEQTAYYTDGLLRLGYILDDKQLIGKGREGIEYTFRHAAPDGKLGPKDIEQTWPFAVFFRAIKADYEANGNQAAVDALRKHFLSFSPEQVGGNLDSDGRSIVNLEGILWTYCITKDPALLDLAEKAYALGKFQLNEETAANEKPIHMHGVTFAEMVKLPVLLYACTGSKRYLDIALHASGKVEQDHMLPDGIPSSAEHLIGNNVLISHETCDISDFTWSWGYFLEVTGDARWGDVIEKAVFNAGLGAIGKDFKSLQYLSSVNQVVATGESNHNGFKYGLNWMQYRPNHETECCAGNVHRFMPNYVGRMWLNDRSGGLVAALYGPSEIGITSAGGNRIKVTENTAYPFDETISFRFSLKRPETLPFSFRIPGWCKGAKLYVNGKELTGIPLVAGTFAKITRRFEDDDEIKIVLPMAPALRTAAGKQGVYVERGPLLYSFAVPERETIDTEVYANLNGKKSENPDFVSYDLRPAGKWNYAIDVREGEENQLLCVEKRETGTAYPFDAGQSPVVIKAPVKEVEGWQLREGRFTPEVPSFGLFNTTESDTRFIELVPYGSTRLRLTVFPKTTF